MATLSNKNGVRIQCSRLSYLEPTINGKNQSVKIKIVFLRFKKIYNQNFLNFVTKSIFLNFKYQEFKVPYSQKNFLPIVKEPLP